MNDSPLTQTPLRLARKAAGLSQADLAKKAGVSQMTISRWESGYPVRRRSDALDRVADILGVPVEHLTTQAVA